MISFRESLFKRDCFCYDNPWRKILNKREKYEGADWIMHFIGHFKTITRHKILVAKGCFKLGLYYQGIMHDMSKYSPTEFLVGVKYYQGTASPNNAERMEEGISMSWLHHKGRNKHHFEYWIDYSIDKDHPGLVGMKIPKKYMAEMFVDRVSAGKIYNGDEFDQKSPLEYFEHGIGASIMCEASRDYLLNLLRMYAEKGEKYTFAYLKNDLKNDMSGYDKISPFQQCKKILRLDRISCICDLKYYHTYSIICNVNQIRSLGCTITCYFEPTFIYHGTSYNRPDVKP